LPGAHGNLNGRSRLSCNSAGDVAAHQVWTARNFSLTFAAVALRIYLAAAMLARSEFEVANCVALLGPKLCCRRVAIQQDA
jgi:hypothetical protein